MKTNIQYEHRAEYWAVLYRWYTFSCIISFFTVRILSSVMSCDFVPQAELNTVYIMRKEVSESDTIIINIVNSTSIAKRQAVHLCPAYCIAAYPSLRQMKALHSNCSIGYALSDRDRPWRVPNSEFDFESSICETVCKDVKFEKYKYHSVPHNHSRTSGYSLGTEMTCEHFMCVPYIYKLRAVQHTA